MKSIEITLFIVLLNCLIIPQFYAQENLGGWKDETIEFQNKAYKKGREILNFCLLESKLQKIYDFRNVIGFYTQVVAGVNYKLTFSAVNKQKDNQIDILHFIIYESLEKSKGDKNKKTITQQFVFSFNDDYALIDDKELLNELSEYAKKLIMPKNSKIVKKNFIYKRLFDEGWVYLLNLDIQNIAENKNDNYEVAFYYDKENIRQDFLFHKKISSTDIRKNSVKISGQCEEIASFFHCEMRRDCTTKLFSQTRKCIKAYKEDL